MKPTSSKKEEVLESSTSANNSSLPFGKGNYTIMLVGLALIIIGFIIMTLDKEEFGFGFLGLTLGPSIAFLGFMVEIYATLKKK
ncbi:MAG: DUF3098 domain-containing protein [Spirosomaceae bacterium]|jgi:hypothetical protein|nr:DUF3098 domain-containing protein [Spirosomataceae bacterium]